MRPRYYSKQQTLNGILYISPWLVGFGLFILGPMLYSIVLSFSKYSLASAPKFVGLSNYVEALTGDDIFWISVKNTVWYVAFFVPIATIGSLALALLLNNQFKGISIFRTIFYLPSVTPIVAMALIWVWIFTPDFGILNYLLMKLGISNPPRWLASPEWSKPGIIIMQLWKVGGPRMIIFLAGLQEIPDQLYESADIDGANMFDKFIHITLPLLSPAIFLNIITTVMRAFQVFAISYVATRGGPLKSTTFYAIHLYNKAFRYFQLGYGCSLAWIFFVFLLLFTLLYFKLSKRWVHYGMEMY
ncbi:MAG: sugar ABC transporter permease [Spirochaetes bacterium]|nr:sugar ABC transporter permease [Spirochaetota bacterium]